MARLVALASAALLLLGGCVRDLPELLAEDADAASDGHTPDGGSDTSWRFVASPDPASTFGLARIGSELWGVTFLGRVLHFDGSRWSVAARPTSDPLKDIWCDGKAECVAVGDNGTVLHRLADSSWVVVSSGLAADLNGVWGSAATDVWIVGDGGTIAHFDGTNVTSESAPTSEDLLDVFGFAASDVWIAGNNGTLLERDGTSWKTAASSTTSSLKSIWGRSADDVWAVGRSVIHYNGASWGQVPIGLSDYNLEDVEVASDGTIWAVGEHALVVTRPAGAGQWAVVPPPSIPASKRPNGVLPWLWTLKILPDGQIWVGGRDGTLLVRDAPTTKR